ncbi:hypothetical protein CspHIS471_0104730 [Cutaneotrichosporon sp. HIS471]|nr:hypothetical protein CspHIS471_0104730 [Cutaneotrichosporon sp. HIS471]
MSIPTDAPAASVPAAAVPVPSPAAAPATPAPAAPVAPVAPVADAAVPAPTRTTAPPAPAYADAAAGASGTGGILQQAKGYLEQVDKSARPYIEKAQASAKPYADAAMAKGLEFKDYLEGKSQYDQHKDHPQRHQTQCEGDMYGVGGKTVADVPAGAAEPGSYPAAPPQSLGHKALGMFDYTLGSVKTAFNTIGESMSPKAATSENPITGTARVPAAVQKPEGELASGTGVGAAAADAAAGVKAALAAPSADAHPVMTTTNTVAHNSKDGDPSPTTSPIVQPRGATKSAPIPFRPHDYASFPPPSASPRISRARTHVAVDRRLLRRTPAPKPETEPVDCSRVLSHSLFHSST